MSFIIVYTTNKDEAEARKIAAHLLKKRLIACANFFPIGSMYWWEGRIQEDKEVVSILKAREEDWEAVKEEITSLHSYGCPCIIRLSADANKGYEDWLEGQASRPGR
ncbi:TPA: divalent-cation tolerance protein CutA [Candidatus Woesearchaeota archaeon]|nr:divalent-cation tolerance protein CutA [Candidatus Woesearchaeota archaeon]